METHSARHLPPCNESPATDKLGALHLLIDAYAAGSAGDSPAAVEDTVEGGSVTYAQLQFLSLVAASELSRLLDGSGGAGSTGCALATWMHRSVRWYAVFVAASRLGTPLVMLSRDMPDRELEAARNSEILLELRPLVVADDDCSGSCEGAVAASALFPSAGRAAAAPRQCSGWSARASQDVLLLCYTGGTTGSAGRAKCVRATQRMVAHEALAYGRLAGGMGLLEQSRPPAVLQQTSCFWAASCIGQVNLALALQGTVVFALTQAPKDPTRAVAAAVQRHGVAVLGAVPSFFALLDPGECPGLRWLLSWGEALPPEVRRRWGAPGRCVTDLLIATEYWLCLHSSTMGAELNGPPPRSVFRAVPGASLRVVTASTDALPSEVAQGEVGRLCISGPMVMRGYLGQAEIADGQEFLTNDMVKEVSPGCYVYCGRADFMAKEKGQWLDLGALEATLHTVPGVKEAAILPDAAGQHVACVSLACGDGCVPACLRALRRALRSCMGARLLLCTELPRVTATQKIDRKALRAGVGRMSTSDKPRQIKDLMRLLLESCWRMLAAAAVCCRFRPLDALRLAYLWNLSLHLMDDRGSGSWATLNSKWLGHLFWSMPAGRLGLFTVMLWARDRTPASRFLVASAVLWGAALAWWRRRLLIWPVAFWAALPLELRQPEYRHLARRLLRSAAAFPMPSLARTPSSSAPEEAASGESAAVTEAPEVAPERAVPEACSSCGTADPYLCPDECEPPDGTQYCSGCWRKFYGWWWRRRLVDDLELPADDTSLGESALHTPDDAACLTGVVPAAAATKWNQHFSPLLEVLARLTGEHNVSGATPLAELGIDSLRGLQLVQVVRGRLSKDISYQDVLACDTVSALASCVEQAEPVPRAEDDAPDSCDAAGGECASFFGPGQWWFACSWLFEHRGATGAPLEDAAFLRAAGRLVERHGAFRTQLADPLELLRFIYDGGQVLVLLHREAAAMRPSVLRSLFQAALYLASVAYKRCWPRVRVWPAGAETCTAKMRISVEHCPPHELSGRCRNKTGERNFFPPGSITLYQVYDVPDLPEPTRSVLHVVLSHAVCDGFSVYPLLADLKALYDNEVAGTAGPEPGLPSALQVSESRLFATLDGRHEGRPERQSLRGQLFSIRGRGYNHDLRLAGQAALASTRLAEQYGLSLDLLLVALTVCALARADRTPEVSLTLYAPLRDGAGESGLIGLFADWRDMVFNFSGMGLTVVGSVLEVADKIRRREWTCFDGLNNPQATLLNFITFDERPVQGFEFLQRPGGDYYPRLRPGCDRASRVQRPRRLVWERQRPEEWFCALDLDERLHGPAWCRRFVHALQTSLRQLRTEPCTPLLPPRA